MLRRIAHCAYNVTDMDPSLVFYCDVLGMTKAFTLDRDGKPWIVYLKMNGGQFIELFHDGVPDAQPKDDMRTGFSHLCLEVDDIREIAARLESHGIPLLYGPPRQGRDLNWQCWAKDPDGNRIEFMQIDPESPQARA